MQRPKFISEKDIDRWSNDLDNDTSLPDVFKSSDPIREVCYAGMWLSEELKKLLCPDEWIIRIQYTAGKHSFGKDPWDVHINFLNSYKSNSLDFETSDNEMN